MKQTSQKAISPLGDGVAAHRARKMEQSPKYRATIEKYRIAQEVAQRLIAYRVKYHLTQHQLAERLGTSYSVISRLERGDRPANLDTLTRIGNVLGFGIVLIDRKPKLAYA